MSVKLLAGEPKPNETVRAIQACNDYLRMGPGRSLGKLLAKYAKTNKNQPPTDSIATLKEWSAAFDWQERVAAYDADRDTEKTEKRRREFETGLAQDVERIRKLKRLARFLEDQIYEEDDPNAVVIVGSSESGATEVAISSSPYPNVWLRDAKTVAKKRVDIFRFNSAIISEYRGVLDDLAKETGGRKTVVTGDKDSPLQVEVTVKSMIEKVYGDDNSD